MLRVIIGNLRSHHAPPTPADHQAAPAITTAARWPPRLLAAHA